MSRAGSGESGADGRSDRPWGLLNVAADLEISVGGTTGHLTGDGDRLILTSAHPERIWAAAATSALPSEARSVTGAAAIGTLAAELAGAGLRLDVTGPHGDVAVLGRGVQSRLGRALTGSSAVRPGAPRALAVLAWGQIPRTAAAAGAAALAVAALWLVSRRTRT